MLIAWLSLMEFYTLYHICPNSFALFYLPPEDNIEQQYSIQYTQYTVDTISIAGQNIQQ